MTTTNLTIIGLSFNWFNVSKSVQIKNSIFLGETPDPDFSFDSLCKWKTKQSLEIYENGHVHPPLLIQVGNQIKNAGLMHIHQQENFDFLAFEHNLSNLISG